jgi:hypothetical protein
MEQWWNDDRMGKLKKEKLQEILLQWHSVLHKSHRK